MSIRPEGERAKTIRAAQRGAAAVSLTVAAVLALTGCGGGSDTSGKSGTGSSPGPDESASVTYQFDEARVADSADQTPFVTTEKSITVKFSDELKAAIPDGKSMTIESFTLRPEALASGMCRLDVDVDYADGGPEALTASAEEEPAEEIVSRLADLNIDESSGDAIVDELPSSDEIDSGRATFVTKDFQHIAIIEKCSEDSEDDMVDLDMPYLEETDNDFASVEIGVLPGGGQAGGEGTTTILTGDSDAEVSASGKWTKPEED